MDVPVTPDDVERAAARIAGHVRRTPVIEHDGLWLKLELLQHAGSFKARGAFNRLLASPDDPGGRGRHGQRRQPRGGGRLRDVAARDRRRGASSRRRRRC